MTALDAINRGDKGKITPAVFISIKDSTTSGIVSYGTVKGLAKWGSGGGAAGGGLKGKVCGKTIGSIKNVTSIANFDPVAAIGNVFCAFFTGSQPKCEAVLSTICEWDAAASSCVTKAAVNICSLVASLDVGAKIKKCGAIQWCKWDAAATTCVKKTPVEVIDVEDEKTVAPTLTPTLAPTEPASPPLDTCKICIHNELFTAMMASPTCMTYVARSSRAASLPLANHVRAAELRVHASNSSLRDSRPPARPSPLSPSLPPPSVRYRYAMAHGCNDYTPPSFENVSCLLCTVTFHANHAHNLTRSP